MIYARRLGACRIRADDQRRAIPAGRTAGFSTGCSQVAEPSTTMSQVGTPGEDHPEAIVRVTGGRAAGTSGAPTGLRVLVTPRASTRDAARAGRQPDSSAPARSRGSRRPPSPERHSWQTPDSAWSQGSPCRQVTRGGRSARPVPGCASPGEARALSARRARPFPTPPRWEAEAPMRGARRASRSRRPRRPRRHRPPAAPDRRESACLHQDEGAAPPALRRSARTRHSSPDSGRSRGRLARGDGGAARRDGPPPSHQNQPTGTCTSSTARSIIARP